MTLIAVVPTFLIGILTTRELELVDKDSDMSVVPALIFAGLAGAVLGGIAGRVEGKRVAGIALLGIAAPILVFTLFLLMNLELGIAFVLAAYAACTIGIVSATRFAFARQHHA